MIRTFTFSPAQQLKSSTTAQQLGHAFYSTTTATSSFRQKTVKKNVKIGHDMTISQ
jgi:hypothetical protein